VKNDRHLIKGHFQNLLQSIKIDEQGLERTRERVMGVEGEGEGEGEG
jgi:hypothetical protein